MVTKPVTFAREPRLFRATAPILPQPCGDDVRPEQTDTKEREMFSFGGHQRVIVAIDGSPSSMVATDWAARDAARRHVPLTLIHVLSDPLIGAWPDSVLPQDLWNWHEQNGRQLLTDARSVADRALLDFDPIAVEEATYAGTTIPVR